MTYGNEINFDGLVGPTHTYGGFSLGNIASMDHRAMVSHPRKAAQQGLDKMLLLHSLGATQGILPPHERPHIPTLRALGFVGKDHEIIEKAFKVAPKIYFRCCSASSMWSANAATICPSSDHVDGCVHITPANLSNYFHRALETPLTQKVLKKIFSDPRNFIHHDPLPAGQMFSDEGAANHTRLGFKELYSSLHLFVYGNSHSSRFPARQALTASEAVARLHDIPKECTIFAQQNPKAIDAGVFHNDVISVGHRHVFLYHEEAFTNTVKVIDEIQNKNPQPEHPILFIRVTSNMFTIEEAVATYLFNSQIVSTGPDAMVLIAPQECAENQKTEDWLNHLEKDKKNPIKEIRFFDLRESMQNGGGPACLRLRIVLTEEERKAVLPQVILDQKLYHTLSKWIEKHYREELRLEDLGDPLLLKESREALDELTQILNLGNLYEFQLNSL